MGKLGSVVRMLSSDKDGEALSALRALLKMLSGRGKDIHWLGDVVEQSLDGGNQQSKPGGSSKRQHSDDLEEMCSEEPASVATWLLKHKRDRLRPRETEFLLNMQDWRGSATERQCKWLIDIAERFGYRP